MKTINTKTKDEQISELKAKIVKLEEYIDDLEHQNAILEDMNSETN